MSDFVIKPRHALDQESAEQPTQDSTSLLKSSIVRIGDQNEVSLEDSVEQLVGLVFKEAPEKHRIIIDCLLDSVEMLPLKTHIYGTVVGLLNAKSFELTGLVLKSFCERLQTALEARDTVRSKLLIRFISELLNNWVVTPKTYSDFISHFVDAALSGIREGDSLMETSKKDAFSRADFLIHLVLIALPYAGYQFCKRDGENLDKLMGQIDSYFSLRPTRLTEIMSPFHLSEEPLDRLSHLFVSVKKCQENGWEIMSISQLYKRFGEKLSSSLQHELPLFRLPGESPLFKSALQVFKIFDDAKDAIYQPIDRILLEDQLLDTIYFFNVSRKECVKQILSIELPYSFEEILVETILGQLLFLPSPEFKIVYYHVLLGDLCKQNPALYGVTYKAVTILFERLGHMDVECIDRLADFFGYHLSNSGYRWDWFSYTEYITQPKTFQHYFIRQSLGVCVNLSFLDRIKSAIPTAFHQIIEAPAPFNFKYERIHDKDSSISHELVNQIIHKQAVDTVVSWLKREVENIDPPRRVEIVLNACFYCGKKSFSHLSHILERYQNYLCDICPTPELKLHVLRCMQEFWGDDWVHQIIYADRLMTFRVVDNLTTIRWLFSETNSTNLGRYEAWRIANSVISKTLGRHETVSREYEKNSKMVERGERPQRLPEVVLQALEMSRQELKELFSCVFTNLVDLLHRASSGIQEDETEPFWFSVASRHFVSLGRKHKTHLVQVLPEIETKLTSSGDISPRISELLEKVKSI